MIAASRITLGLRACVKFTSDDNVSNDVSIAPGWAIA
jgi:hypothetical protein